MPEALKLIKQELGDDALILNTKKVKTGGLFGLFQKDRLEVTAALEEQAEAPQQPLESSAVKAVAPAAEQEQGQILEELKSLKRLMMHELPEERLPEQLRPIRELLKKQEVEEAVQTELLAKLLPQVTESKTPAEELLRNELVRFVEQHQGEAVPKTPAVLCFIGPTGVGKTTTIAKVAAEQLLDEKRTVGLITADTYRIGAVAQLKTYGNILDVPVEVAESQEQLAQALDALSACEVILIDTAGRNYQQAHYIEELQRLLPKGQEIHTALVLSLASKYEDMVQIIRNFEALRIDELLLTKQDETATAGAILNLMHRFPIPLRRIATGQNVPDDLVAATPERIVDYLMGEQRHA